MLNNLRHGRIISQDGADDSEHPTEDKPAPPRPDCTPSSVVRPDAGEPSSPENRFDYLFEGDGIDDDGEVVAHLTALADAMVDSATTASLRDSGIAPIFTYFGQFIDHDITANTDRETPGSADFNIDRPDLQPAARADVVAQKSNFRLATLRLDSLYGDGPDPTPFDDAVKEALRDPDDRAKMRLGTVEKVTPSDGAGAVVPLPVDRLADLPRVGVVLSTNPARGELDEGEATRVLGLDGQRTPEQIRRLALVGDSRNDENLIVAQLHLAFLRFHNHLVDDLGSEYEGKSEDERFAAARELLRWTYQWLIVHEYLPTVCDAITVKTVIDKGAPVYRSLVDSDDAEGHGLPMPLEFSVAAFRFGHSMVRGSYDFNRNFGREANVLDMAPFDLLFQFTGTGGFAGGLTLPDNWIIEWDRFVQPERDERVALRIDTNLAGPLDDLKNDVGQSLGGVLGRLALRNLLRGYVLNLPSAQSVLADLDARHGITIPVLTSEELLAGPTGDAVASGGFDRSTPLWFYVLKEAEEQVGGQHLGLLGSRIVAETLIGLLLHDDKSYLSVNPHWAPTDAGIDVAGIADLVRLAFGEAG